AELRQDHLAGDAGVRPRRSRGHRGVPRRARRGCDADMSMLSVRSLHVAYGQIEALHGIELDVETGEIVTLIGANGAGKTTTPRSISGLLKPRSGSVNFNDRNITAVKPHVITAMGI